MSSQRLLALSTVAAAAAAILLLQWHRRRHKIKHNKLQLTCKKCATSAAQHAAALRTHFAAVVGDLKAESLLLALRTPPSLTTVRVNIGRTSVDEARAALSHSLRTQLQPHPSLDDVLCLHLTGPHTHPLLSKIVAVDRGCAEAVLRGADIFAPGIRGCSADLMAGEDVSIVCVDPLVSSREVHRGEKLRREAVSGGAGWLHVGNGRANYGRRDLFPPGQHASQAAASSSDTAAVSMTARVYDGPSLNGVLPESLFLQNLPSALAVHLLDPQPGELIVDLCSAPGGKTTHAAALLRHRSKGIDAGRVIAIDRSKARLASVGTLAERLGVADLIELVHMDATRVHGDKNAKLKLRGSVDRVLLDPPCSALGIRPRLALTQTVDELKSCAAYQKRLLESAVALLRPGGTLLYSTCTISVEENERVIEHALRGQQVAKLRLVPPPERLRLGGAGWAGGGLTDAECSMVQRFDPSTASGEATIGFFVARLERVA